MDYKEKGEKITKFNNFVVYKTTNFGKSWDILCWSFDDDAIMKWLPEEQVRTKDTSTPQKVIWMTSEQSNMVAKRHAQVAYDSHHYFVPCGYISHQKSEYKGEEYVKKYGYNRDNASESKVPEYFNEIIDEVTGMSDKRKINRLEERVKTLEERLHLDRDIMGEWNKVVKSIIVLVCSFAFCIGLLGAIALT